MTHRSVAVILPTRDRAWCLSRAIDSVLEQSYDDFELIVIDDGSTDDTRDVLAAYRGQLTVLRQEALGPYPARNHALRITESPLVAFIDSDDTWSPHRLERQVPLMARPEVGLVFGNARLRGTDRTTFDITLPSRGRCAREFIWGNFVATVTVLARRCALGAFSESAPLSADYLAWYRIARHFELDFVAEPVATYTVHPDGISYDLTRALQTRIHLFAEELEAADDRTERVLLRRLLFNLSLHLALQSARGRSGDLTRARHVLLSSGGVQTPEWLSTFVAHHARARVRRLRSHGWAWG